MISQLGHQLKKLEGRFPPPSEPSYRVFNFVEANGDVTATLTLGNGESKWWYTPGYDSSSENMGAGLGKDGQMAADGI